MTESRAGVVQALLQKADRDVAEARHETDLCRLRVRKLERENERLRQALGDVRAHLVGVKPDKDIAALRIIFRVTDCGART